MQQDSGRAKPGPHVQGMMQQAAAIAVLPHSLFDLLKCYF